MTTTATLNPHAVPFFPACCGRNNRVCQSYTATDRKATGLRLLDLPNELLEALFARVPSQRDAASLACSSRRLRVLSRNAAVTFRILPLPKLDFDELKASSEQRLASCASSFPGTAILDFSGHSVEDSFLLEILPVFRKLHLLSLNTSRKLSMHFVQALLGKTGGHNFCTSLEGLSLQRSFQLSDSAAASILGACNAADSTLATLCMSHMSLSPSLSHPQAQLVLSSPAAFSSLLILALHNSSIEPQALHKILGQCPQLLLLLLGGCTLTSQQAVLSLPPAAVNPTDGAQTQALLASLGCTMGPGSSMGAAVQALSRELGQVLAASSVRVLEVTHWLPSMAAGLKDELAALGAQVSLINLRQSGAVQELLDRQPGSTLGVVLGQCRGQYVEQQVHMALCGAARCTSAQQRTALHAAADEGRLEDVQALLALDPALDARDRSGAGPLFCACYAGQAACVAELLAAGANAALTNTQGESCLYIAALRGHAAVVDCLLQHLTAKGLPWMASGAYRDGWTPLMAAAVAGHEELALRLLQTAGPSAAYLARQVGKGGMTCAHVAARRGCLPLLQALLQVGGKQLARAEDGLRRTPIQTAERNGQWEAAALLSAGYA